MTQKAVLYDRTTTYMFPSGKLATPEIVAAEYPATQAFDYVFITDVAGQMIQRIEPLAQIRDRYGVSDDCTVDEALSIITDILNTPAEAQEPEPSAEERIAAALEYQNMMAE